MGPPPVVVGSWGPVHGTLDEAVEGRAVLARTVALPPVGLVQFDFIVEAVVDLPKGWLEP